MQEIFLKSYIPAGNEVPVKDKIHLHGFTAGAVRDFVNLKAVGLLGEFVLRKVQGGVDAFRIIREPTP